MSEEERGFSNIPYIEIQLNEQGPQGIQGIQGEEGPPGPGITNIEKISTEGLVDTYRIYYGPEPEEGEEQLYFDFQIVNGAGGNSYVSGFGISIDDDTISFDKSNVSISDIVDDTNTYPINRAKGLSGVQATTTELNSLTGISSNVQMQLNNKQNIISESNKIRSDFVDDTNQSHRFATASQLSQITTNQSDISTINGKIPSQASQSNQLADKDYVNESVQSGSAFFDGNWASYSAIPSTVEGFTIAGLVEPGNGNYLVVLDDETHSDQCWRYKYTAESDTQYDKSNWHAEYMINEEPFTLAEMEAIRSGITSTIVGQIPGKEDKSNKVTNISSSSTDDQYPSAKCVYDIIGNIESMLRSV